MRFKEKKQPEKATWGGVRPGAGRPPGSKTQKTYDQRFWSPDRRFDHEHPELWQHEENRLREERRALTYALTFGPNHVNGLSDAELRVLFEEWGREAGVLSIHTGEPTGVWPATSYAYQRYIIGLSVDDARAAAEDATERRDAAEYLARFGVPSTRR